MKHSTIDENISKVRYIRNKPDNSTNVNANVQQSEPESAKVDNIPPSVSKVLVDCNEQLDDLTNRIAVQRKEAVNLKAVRLSLDNDINFFTSTNGMEKLKQKEGKTDDVLTKGDNCDIERGNNFDKRTPK